MWKAKILSLSGRMTLEKAVLGNLPTFYLSLFSAPIGIIEELEKIQRQFIWRGDAEKATIHWVAWEKLKAPKEVGGASLGSLRNLNLALLAKWWWKFKTCPDSLWARIVMGFHNPANRPWFCFAKHNRGGVWSCIDKAKNGLWKLNIDVKEIMNTNDGGLSWRSDFVVDGVFSVARLRNRLDRASHLICDGDFWWLNSVPKKVVNFIWQAKQGRIPSAEALRKRNIQVPSTMCGICEHVEESVDHILTSCSLARNIITMVLKWCNVLPQFFLGVNEVLDFAGNWGHCPKKKELLTCIIYRTLWSLWKARNDRIFKEESSKPAKILDYINSLVFTWRKYRSPSGYS
ncbi:uncharacterized protein LOC128126024 [Lactuca sativa]|uniref:uncharacterized protein LOC128126024 n=1 Tax=Lactuca sativa TaxID=4236 RepID=UPI0022AE877D|nr:uncharacterized protein LOC128126024 [Lactuca sativa]